MTDPQIIFERFNSFFIDTVEDLLGKNNSYAIKQTPKHDIKTCPKSMFASPVIEIEVENVIKMLKGKSSAGFDEIPEFLVKCCIKFIKVPLTHVFNLSLKFGIFPEFMKMAKIRPLFKKGDKLEIQNYRHICYFSLL